MSGVLVIGRTGQLARALAEEMPQARFLGRAALDLGDRDRIAPVIAAAWPDLVINAAAYTAVDKAESDPETAFAVNAEGPARLAALCAAAGLPLVHISTDYVFDGLKGAAYVEEDPPGPASAYGASKAAGEMAVKVANPRHVIVRTSWLYGIAGTNFVKTMLRLAAEREEVRVVNDQIGGPTFADDLADAVLEICEKASADSPADIWGTYHVAGTGATSWHGLAEAVFRESAAGGRKVPRLTAIPTREYPTPARRPACSLLDTAKFERVFGKPLPAWERSLQAAMPRIMADGEGA